MLGNNLLELLTSKEKQLSGLPQIPPNYKRTDTTQKNRASSSCLSFDSRSGVKLSIANKQQNEPYFLLEPRGIPAQLCIPDEKRTPLLVSDLKLIYSWVLYPNLKDGTKMYWFKIQKPKHIPNTCLVIVDGITVSTIRDLNLGRKEMRHLYRKRLQKGLVSPYLGNYKEDESQTIGTSNDSNCEEPMQKRLKQQHLMPEVLNGLQTWLPQTSALLPLKVEVVSPTLYGHSLLLDIFLIPLSRETKNNIMYHNVKEPKSLRLLDSDEVLHKQAKGETMDSCNDAATTFFEQQETPHTGMSQSSPTILYYNQLAQRWDGSRSSACTSSSKYWTKGTTRDDVKVLKPDKFDRRSLLMNLEDMLSNNYPFHPNVHAKFTRADSDDILDYSKLVGTKRSYIPVRADSPLFSLDCEFKKMNVDSISVVNECGQAVYETHVAEPNHHLNCCLIECAECRKPSLEDVQQHLIRYLPPDAILVGHTISNDLWALKMYHPYIIDTSLHFNFENNIPSLSGLCKHFLGKAIQLKKNTWHDATEDALATLQVLQLKLQHSFTYGMRSLGGFVPSSIALPGYILGDSPKPAVDKLYYWHLFECLDQKKFGNVPGLRARVCVVAEERFKEEWRSSLKGVDDEYAPTLLPDGMAVLEGVCASLTEHDLSVAHIKADQQINSDETSERLDALATLDAQLMRVHASLPNKSLFSVLFIDSNCEISAENVSNGIYMMGIKGQDHIIQAALSEDTFNNK